MKIWNWRIFVAPFRFIIVARHCEIVLVSINNQWSRHFAHLGFLEATIRCECEPLKSSKRCQRHDYAPHPGDHGVKPQRAHHANGQVRRIFLLPVKNVWRKFWEAVRITKVFTYCFGAVEFFFFCLTNKIVWVATLLMLLYKTRPRLVRPKG